MTVVLYEHIQKYTLIVPQYWVVRTKCSLHLSYILLDQGLSGSTSKKPYILSGCGQPLIRQKMHVFSQNENCLEYFDLKRICKIFCENFSRVSVKTIKYFSKYFSFTTKVIVSKAYIFILFLDVLLHSEKLNFWKITVMEVLDIFPIPTL